MKKCFLPLLIAAAALLCGCDYTSANTPRKTVTLKSNALTTVTPREETRPDTYSEYIASLSSVGADEHAAASSINGIMQDTAAAPGSTQTTMPTLPAQSEPTVTTVPPSIESAESTVTCFTPTQPAETALPIPSLGDIPSIPSEAVMPDTAVTPNNP